MSTMPFSLRGFYILSSLDNSPLILILSKAKVNNKYKRVKVKLSTPSFNSKPKIIIKRTRLINIIIFKLKKKTIKALKPIPIVSTF